jgi:hypothetical protein
MIMIFFSYIRPNLLRISQSDKSVQMDLLIGWHRLSDLVENWAFDKYPMRKLAGTMVSNFCIRVSIRNELSSIRSNRRPGHLVGSTAGSDHL